jgi:hypothetical protein
MFPDIRTRQSGTDPPLCRIIFGFRASEQPATNNDRASDQPIAEGLIRSFGIDSSARPKGVGIQQFVAFSTSAGLASGWLAQRNRRLVHLRLC